MKRYATVPIAQLQSDVAVDPDHVQGLVDSMKDQGQIAPVIVREETNQVIDGFHRVAARSQAGFDDIEAVLIDCDDETFWDLRIASASFHKAVTFARVIDWIDQAFALAPPSAKGPYKTAYSLFARVRQGTATPAVREWAEHKARQWGLAVSTIENWLKTKEVLAPDVLREATSSPSTATLSVAHYREVADALPGRPELQRQLVQKAKDEELSQKEVRAVGQALRRAETPGEVESILAHPTTLTDDQLVRDAKLDALLDRPAVQDLHADRRTRANVGLALEILLDIQQLAASVRRLKPDVLDALTPSQHHELSDAVDELAQELRRVQDALLGVVDAQLVEGGAA